MKTYRDVLHGQVFDVLLGIKTTAGSVLQYVYPVGFAGGVRKCKAIGHGEPYGSFFLKYWWQKNMSMLEVAKLGFLIIKYIQEFELDNTVGIGQEYPQVWLIPNQQITEGATDELKALANPHLLSVDEMSRMHTEVVQMLTTFKQQSCWERLLPTKPDATK